MIVAGMKTARSLLVALCILVPQSVRAEVPYDINAMFNNAGCRTLQTREVARTEIGRQRVYVAWCSGLDVYLLIIKCDGFACRLVD
jgi:hypothetical protein